MKTRLLSALVASSFGLLAACTAAPAEEATGSSVDAVCSTECPSGNLSGDALLTPVNRTNRLRSDWAPVTHTLPAGYRNGTNQGMRDDAAAKFMAMADAAKSANVNIVCLSGYRSFQTQCQLFASYAASNGCDQANTFSAHAGHSEHQLGTVCDIALSSSGSTFIAPGGPADTWLRAHAHEHGFANSYPNGDKNLNDGYIHEPWHYRYIGVAAATALKQKEAALPGGQRLSVPVFIAGLSSEERSSLEGGSVPPAPPPSNDPCASGGQARQGRYCAKALGGGATDNRLLTCTNGVTTATEPCANGCKEMPAGSPDQCEASAPTPATPSCATIPFSGQCTGKILEYCVNGVYNRVDCGTKTDGRTSCGEDPREEVGKNCIKP